MENQHSFLRLSILLTKILAYVSAALGIMGAVIILFGKTPGAGKLASLGVLLAGGIYFLVLYLLSELIRLFLDMDQKLTRLDSVVQPAKREIQ